MRMAFADANTPAGFEGTYFTENFQLNFGTDERGTITFSDDHSFAGVWRRTPSDVCQVVSRNDTIVELLDCRRAGYYEYLLVPIEDNARSTDITVGALLLFSTEQVLEIELYQP